MKKLSLSFAPIFGVIMLVAGSIFLAFFMFVSSLSNQKSLFFAPNITESDDPLISKVRMAPTITAPQKRIDNFTLGRDDAPVKIFEFSDFSCPYCKIMSAALKNAVSRHADVQLIWKDFPITALHPQALAAHLAARCAGEQKKFWEYQDKLFADQNKFSRPDILTIAQNLDLNMINFASCLDNTTALTAIGADIQEGNDLEIDGTPYLFIGDQRLSGILSDEELEQIIEFQKQFNQSVKK